ncbi:hypothetical protein [Fictibacillus barbaricus]|nr:hypothetical protein [Fictibacillus barbaricus]
MINVQLVIVAKHTSFVHIFFALSNLAVFIKKSKFLVTEMHPIVEQDK